ncbi:MAG: TlpA disulfide reductase family protein [Chitinophagaceae bacterium]
MLLLFLNVTPLKAQSIPVWKVSGLNKYIAASDSILVINFWATFCKPCNEEIPYFETIVNKYKKQKVKLLLVSLDMKDQYPHKLKAFAKKNKYSSQIVWLNEINADYFCPAVDSTWSGGIPATLIVNTSTGYRKFLKTK